MARVLCAMSGGVDSSVAAHLLKEAGHEVLGVFLRLGPDAAGRAQGASEGARRSCCSIEDSRDAALVAGRLGIPFYALNAQEDFGRIIDHFTAEYHRGRTPNPCVLCNHWIKFGSLLEKARALGCDALATGHYARADRGPDGRPRLLRAADPAKDQSYFLFLLGPEVLGMALFPVGGLSKAEVRRIARERDLPVADKPDSQEICFVPGDYREVLEARDPGCIKEGRFEDSQGTDLGLQPGHQNFTVGQRRGLGRAFGEPRYVVRIDAARNVVVLGSREDLVSGSLRAADVRWISIPEPAPGGTLEAQVRIRHRHRAAPARLRVEAPGRVLVDFDEPQSAVTPGQAAVFYDGDVVLGGGWIE